MTSVCFAGGYSQLPRDFEPFTLGMLESEFISLTGVTPNHCLICIKKEKMATLDNRHISKYEFFEDQLEGADFFFYESKLYRITTGSVTKDVFLARREYESLFGGPGQEIRHSNGTSAIKWDDNSTIITLNFRESDNLVYSVNYYDWNLKEERDWQHSLSSKPEKITRD